MDPQAKNTLRKRLGPTYKADGLNRPNHSSLWGIFGNNGQFQLATTTGRRRFKDNSELNIYIDNLKARILVFVYCCEAGRVGLTEKRLLSQHLFEFGQLPPFNAQGMSLKQAAYPDKPNADLSWARDHRFWNQALAAIKRAHPSFKAKRRPKTA